MRAIAAKSLRWLLRFGIIILLAYALLLGIVFVFMQKDPQEFAHKYLSEISQKTGLKFNIGAVNVSLLPLPALALSDVVVIKPDQFELKIAWLSMRPSLLKLLRGDFTPGALILLRPRFKAHFDLPLTSPAQLWEKLKPETSSDSKFEFPECDIDLVDGHALIDNNQDTLTLASVQGHLSLDAPLEAGGSLQFAALRIENDKRILFSLENFKSSGIVNLASFLTNAHDLKISGLLFLRDYLHNGKFNLDFDGSPSGWKTQFEIKTILDLNKSDVEASLGGRVTQLAESQEINFRALEWQLDADHGRLDATLALPENPEDFSVKGSFMAPRLSLTQWMGWARNLAPGLQLALDNILHASLDFELDKKSLTVSDIKATCTGSLFRGSGGVPDFSQPVVMLDLNSEAVNLGLAIPESLGNSPQPPHFFFSPLTPMPGEPLKAGENGIAYDIRIASKNVRYGPFDMQNGSVRIYPGKLDKSGLEDVLLDGKASLYKGSLNGRCILGADPSLPMNISGTGRNINGAELTAKLPFIPMRQGTINADVNVFSKGKTLDSFLRYLKGPISVKAEKVVLKSSPQEAIKSIEAKTQLRGASLEKKHINFDGTWQLNYNADLFDANGNMSGKISVGNDDMTFKNLTASAQLSLKKIMAFFPAGSKIKAEGNISYANNNLTLNQASINCLGLKTHLTSRINLGKESAEGSLRTENIDLPALFKEMGIKNMPDFLRNGKMAADFTANKNNIKLDKIKGSLGNINFGGTFNFLNQAKPFLHFSFNMDAFDLDKDFLGKSSAPANSKWNFNYLKEIDADGEIKCQEITLYKLKVHDVKLPLRLHNGKLTISKVTGRFYGAPIQSRCTLDFSSGLALSASMGVHGFDLGKLGEDRKHEGKLIGTAGLDANIHARLTGPRQMPRALGGNWSFSVINGSWQSRDNKGKLKGSPTNFSKVTASGNIENGVLKSSDFLLLGPGLKVNGEGWLNLDSEKIDCKFNVNMKNVPDFPLYIWGSLKDTKTSIGAGKLMLNAIGGIATGFVNILGGIVEGAWKIFQ